MFRFTPHCRCVLEIANVGAHANCIAILRCVVLGYMLPHQGFCVTHTASLCVCEACAPMQSNCLSRHMYAGASGSTSQM